MYLHRVGPLILIIDGVAFRGFSFVLNSPKCVVPVSPASLSSQRGDLSTCTLVLFRIPIRRFLIYFPAWNVVLHVSLWVTDHINVTLSTWLVIPLGFTYTAVNTVFTCCWFICTFINNINIYHSKQYRFFKTNLSVLLSCSSRRTLQMFSRGCMIVVLKGSF